MIHKLLATIRKEILLLLRDKVGLSILFIMPMILIFVMTVIQDSAFKSINEKGLPIVFVNNDKDSLGIQIENGLKSNELCTVSDSIDGQPATLELAKKAVAEGHFLVGIVVPQGATATLRKNVIELVGETMQTDEDSTANKNATASATNDSIDITIFVDPVAKKSFLTSLTSSLREFISEIKTKIIFETFSDEIAKVIPGKSSTPKSAFAKTQIIQYKEIYASTVLDKIVPNTVQHNVPAWTIFAMFFIVIPLGASIIKEKNEGSIFRLYTMPSSHLLLSNGKVIVYVLVCMIQFVLMLTVGLIFLPMLGMPVLNLGNSYTGILIMAMCTAFAATGFSILVGTLAETEHQAAIMGSLSIILLSALGGIWVPTYVMPELMRNISSLSPLNWALQGFYKLFLRGADTKAILPDAAKLIVFFVVTMGVSSVINSIKRKI